MKNLFSTVAASCVSGTKFIWENKEFGSSGEIKGESGDVYRKGKLKGIGVKGIQDNIVDRTNVAITEKFESDMPTKKTYPVDFIARVKEVLPDHDMKEALAAGNINVGLCLDSARGFAMMDANAVIKAFKSGKQEKVLEAAERRKKLDDLYAEWLKYKY